MPVKTFKYEEFLKRFPQCPPSDCKEKNTTVYRWTHNPVESEDFIPLNIIGTPPVRMLDETDKMCMGYGLSMFDTLENSIRRYRSIFNGMRPRKKEDFKLEKGTFISRITVKEKDGCSTLPNKTGHLTFFEYKDVSLKTQVLEIIDIFETDD